MQCINTWRISKSMYTLVSSAPVIVASDRCDLGQCFETLQKTYVVWRVILAGFSGSFWRPIIYCTGTLINCNSFGSIYCWWLKTGSQQLGFVIPLSTTGFSTTYECRNSQMAFFHIAIMGCRILFCQTSSVLLLKHWTDWMRAWKWFFHLG